MTAAPVTGMAPRLLRGAGADVSLAEHRRMHGDLPDIAPEWLLRAVDDSGLTGRGGAGFPAARKLRSIAGRKNSLIIANGAEGEPASAKDVFLMRRLPHLVLDGLQVVADAVGSNEVYLAVASNPARHRLDLAIAERNAAGVDRTRVRVLPVPDVFLAGEESALVNAVEGRASLPRSTPPRVFEKGAFGRPTLVQNVETLAHIALIARHGAAWFREVGSVEDPGSMLVSISGAVARPGIAEVARGSSIEQIIAAAGGLRHAVQAVLVGGYHGTWLTPTTMDFRPGAGVVVALPTDVCGLVETARVVAYLADQSAQQCGPCLNGLPALASVLGEIARGRSGGRAIGPQVRRATELAALVERRGACHHPDGSVRFIRSALSMFETEIDLHAHGRCSATDRRPFLPTPGVGGAR